MIFIKTVLVNVLDSDQQLLLYGVLVSCGRRSVDLFEGQEVLAVAENGFWLESDDYNLQPWDWIRMNS